MERPIFGGILMWNGLRLTVEVEERRRISINFKILTQEFQESRKQPNKPDEHQRMDQKEEEITRRNKINLNPKNEIKRGS
jgi:hypothetical protein